MSEVDPVRVAIVGGGCAGMTAAWELSRPELGGRYEVTVYQLGWRLGGKGASGRGPGDRIEEHGLHVWLGFYENAFRVMRECYEELGRDPAECRIAHWRDAFFPDPVVGVADRSRDGRWLRWLAYFPPSEGLPGDPLDQRSPFTVQAYLVRTVQLLRTLLCAVREREIADAGASPWEVGEEPVADAVARLLKGGQLVTAAALIEGLRLLETVVATMAPTPVDLPLRLLDAVASGARDFVERAVAGDDEQRRLWEIIDLTTAILRGCVRFRLAFDPRGFDAIDDYDCREWLLMNGASERSVNSAVVRGLYDLALAYEEGDASKPGLAAGQAIRGAFRMFFTYRGALFWKMRSGMGDVVFAPLYEALRRRGVRFEFFHRLEDVKVAHEAGDAHPHVSALEFDVQAEPEGGEYEPLVPVRDLPCWPAEPVWDRLRDGAKLRKEGRDFESHWDRSRVRRRTLKVSEDFDHVVLAIGGGAVRHACGELVRTHPRWREMVDAMHTVATQAFQVWLRDDVRDLGWQDAPPNISAFEKPFDTWADMTHLVPEETFPDDPRAVAYFCGVLPCERDAPAKERAEHPRDQADRVHANAVSFLDEQVRHLWPKAVARDGGFRWELLVDPAGRPPKDGEGEERFATQYWRANVNPTDRYVLCLPGTVRQRISPLEMTHDNLTVAGDWTGCGFAEGCVEAAVMSGRLAAHALSGSPRLEDIVGFDHP